MKKDCDKKEKIKKITVHRQVEGVHISSIVNEGIRALLNLSIFFYEKISHHKKHKTHTSEQKQKKQHFYAHKKHLRRKSLV